MTPPQGEVMMAGTITMTQYGLNQLRFIVIRAMDIIQLIGT
jgi:hypothetical protein